MFYTRIKLMRKGLLILLFMLCTVLQGQAYELILPRAKSSISNTNYVFFVGKANNAESISINGCPIYIAPNGAFAHSVKLKNELLFVQIITLKFINFIKRNVKKMLKFLLKTLN